VAPPPSTPLTPVIVAQRQPQTIPELVDSSPSMMADGSVVLGSRTTSVYLLDPDSGALINGFHNVGASLAELPGLIGAPVAYCASSLEQRVARGCVFWQRADSGLCLKAMGYSR
jgi:hypothetical protein